MGYQREHRGATPFLLLATKATGDTIARAQSLDVSGFLAIPFSADELKNASRRSCPGGLLK